jgi:tetratricopeptide (TPR) repeat protein
VPEAWAVTAVVAVQALPFVSRRLIWPEWMPLLEALLAACPAGQSRLRFELAIALGRLHDLGLKLDAAIEVYREAEAVAQEVADLSELARAQYYLGWAHMNRRDYERAEAYARAVLESLAAGAGAEAWLAAEARRMLGRIAERRGDLAAAEELLREAIALRRPIGRPVELARSVFDLANVLQQLGRFGEAIGCFEEAGRLLAPTTSELDKFAVQLNLGVLCFAQGDWPAAEAMFRGADTLWLRRSGDVYRRALVATCLGNVMLKQARWLEAESHLRLAVSLWDRLEDPLELANAVGGVAEALAGQGQAQEAAALFEQALDAVRRFPDDAKAQRLLAFFQGELDKLAAGARPPEPVGARA